MQIAFTKRFWFFFRCWLMLYRSYLDYSLKKLENN